MSVLGGEQFKDLDNIQHPLPRLRAAYARQWGHSAQDWLRKDFGATDEGIVEASKSQANMMVENAFYPDPDGSKFARKLLYSIGFKNRHNTNHLQ